MAVRERFITKPGRRKLMVVEECLDVGEKLSHAHSYKCDDAHRQGVKHLTYPRSLAACDTAHMAEEYEVARVKAELKRLMDRKGIKAKPLAKLAGLGETAVRDIFERESADMKVGTLHKLAGALDVTIDDIVGATAVPVGGRIGAGGSVIYTEAHLGDVPRPPGVATAVEALEVEGTSMLPRYSSGDVVYIARAHDGVQDDDIGEFCAVRLKSGETYVKQLALGSRPGFFTLRSLNAEDIVDVEIEWATPIIFVLPRAARRRMGY